MQKLLLLLLVGVVLLFTWSNTHNVEVGLVVGRPVHVRLIFLLLTVFLLGYFTSVLVTIYVNRIKAKARHTKIAEDEDEGDEFFEN